ncbi:MAG: DUF4250 domain-containing protein [Lachnospiraceae bacterium]|nr:DUF4250 domain-containing protein [Lachnospiraceae bacterium]
MTLPKDPFILLSFINTELRDNYDSLDELCAAASVDRAEIEKSLTSINYRYDEALNQFK